MLSFLLLFLSNLFLNQAAILQCDFETDCNDFVTDYNWGLTDGLHPHSINHDHTLNTSSGHYLFYNPQSTQRFTIAEIKTNDWLYASTDRAVCFRMWYYTPRISLPFNIQLVQGDDEQLTRIAASITGKDPSINDWTLVNVTLPSEKVKLFIRLNVSAVPLAFDDFSVDYCDGPRPSPPKILFECDFESSCADKFVSLPDYPYQWSILQASDAVKIESGAPSVDYTFGNGSGHYALLTNSKIINQGSVGYLHLQQELQITSQESYCLNFQYYGYGRSYMGNLRVYSLTSNESQTIQMLWPSRSSGQYIYTSDKWTWGIINLPIGHYSLLFRVDTTDISPRTFALDNIAITSCDYPSSQLSPYYSLLSFSCTFDNLTMCDMTNGDRFTTPTFNFTVFTGDTVPNRDLGPTRDHTSNSSSGGFLYWNRQLPFTAADFGNVHPSTTIEQNFGMCVRFAYYVKSLAVNKNGTIVSMSAGGCYGAALWYQSLDDSQGWQIVVLPVLKFACAETFYFGVGQRVTIPVSVAFDDIEIGQCSSFSPTTTSTLTSTRILTTTSDPLTSTTSDPLTSTTSDPLTSTTSDPLTSTTSDPLTSTTSDPLTSTTSDPLTSTTSDPLTSTTSDPLTSTTSDPLTSTTSDPLTSTTSDPLTSTTSDPLTSTTSDPLTSTTSDPLTSTTSDPLTSTTSDPLTSTTSDPLTSTTSDPLTSTTSDPLTSTTSDPLTSTTSDPLTSTTMPPATTPSNAHRLLSLNGYSLIIIYFLCQIIQDYF